MSNHYNKCPHSTKCPIITGNVHGWKQWHNHQSDKTKGNSSKYIWEEWKSNLFGWGVSKHWTFWAMTGRSIMSGIPPLPNNLYWYSPYFKDLPGHWWAWCWAGRCPSGQGSWWSQLFVVADSPGQHPLLLYCSLITWSSTRPKCNINPKPNVILLLLSMLWNGQIRELQFGPFTEMVILLQSNDPLSSKHNSNLSCIPKFNDYLVLIEWYLEVSLFIKVYKSRCLYKKETYIIAQMLKIWCCLLL